MNVLKKVKDFIGTRESLEGFGIQNAAPKSQQDMTELFARIYKNSGRLSLPAVISGELARLVTLEFRSQITGSKRAEFLSCQYKRIIPKIREITETACALGGVVLKPYVKDGKIDITCVTPDMFIPTDINPYGEITGGVFIDRLYKGGKVYTRLESHCFKGGAYIIENKCFISDRIGNVGREVPLGAVDAWRKIKPKVVVSELTKPLFAYFKIPSGTLSLPLGEAVFSKAIPLITDAEEQYQRLLWEFESGERALYIDDAAIRDDKSIPKRRLYRMINQENLFTDWTPEIREESIINGLDEIFRRIEFNSGLAYGTLSKISDTDKTAEEVRASKQRSYAKVTEIQKSLENALIDLVYAMDELCDLYFLSPKGEYDVNFEFDDSIIADRNREFDERIALFEAGIISKDEMREWYFGARKGEENDD